MQEIWKLAVTGSRMECYLPAFAKVLTVQVDNKTGAPVIWVIVTPEQSDGQQTPTERRVFETIGTGEPFTAAGLAYVGTWQEGPFVWHLFEVKQ